MPSPPRLAGLLLRRLVRRDLLEFIEGDLNEEFARRSTGNRGAAHCWYWREAVTAALMMPRRRSGVRPSSTTGDRQMTKLVRDLRFGARTLIKSPGYALVVTLTVALAIGANTVIFSFANPFLVKPLPIVDQKNLAFVYSVDPQRGMPRGRSSYLDYLDWRARLRSFTALSAWTDTNVTLTDRREAQRLQARVVTPSLFSTWGLQPAAGRLLRDGDEQPGRPCALVLSDHLWSARFQRDPAVVSTSIAVDGRSCEVVGVMTPAIEIGNMSLIDVWMPLVDDPARAARDARVLSISGRLRPGMTVAEAGAEVQTIAQQLQREHPDTNAGWTSRTLSARDAMAGTNTHLILGMLMLVVVFILLIACANVANLMLARVTGRRRELAVRTALGATRWTIVRELVSESCWLGGAGGVLGLALAHASLRVIRAAAEEPFFKQIVIDRNVILFAFVLSFLTPLLFSVLPALHSSDVSAERLKDGGRTSTGQRTRSRAVLVIAQVSLALMLLVVAGLVLRTLVEMNRVDYGFNPGPILTAEIEMPAWKYANRDGAVRFERDLLDALRHSVDVEGAATTSALPVLETGVRTQFDAAGRASQAENRPWAFQVRASDRYFDTIGIPILRGRQFTDGDREGREPVAVIDAETARRYWSSVDQALGAKIALAQPGGDGPQWRRIVGIVGSVANPDVELASDPHVYLPMLERPSTTVVIVIRTSAFERASGALRKAVASIDRDVPLFNVRSMTDRIGEELSSVRILTMLFVAFAAIALALASGGLYSVISYSVGTRSQEIGVRMALGAVPTDIHRLIFKQGFQLVVVGTLIGLGGAALLGRALSSMLFNVTPFDPPTYVSVVVLVLASSVLAIVVPAWRATRLDPVRSLRAE